METRVAECLRRALALVAAGFNGPISLKPWCGSLVICTEEDMEATQHCLRDALFKGADFDVEVMLAAEDMVNGVRPGGLACLASETGATQQQVIAWLKLAIRRADRVAMAEVAT